MTVCGSEHAQLSGGWLRHGTVVVSKAIQLDWKMEWNAQVGVND
jgi:hypothetical protein